MRKQELPESYDETVYLHCGVGNYNWADLTVRASAEPIASPDFGTIIVGEAQISIAIHHRVIDERVEQLALLRAHEREIIARHHIEVKEVREAIQKLLAIESHVEKPLTQELDDSIPF